MTVNDEQKIDGNGHSLFYCAIRSVRQSPPGGDVRGGKIPSVGNRCVATPSEDVEYCSDL
jgi:hypothetical protein